MAHITPESAVTLTAAGATSSASTGTTLTSGSAHTKGSWTQLTSSIPSDVVGLYLSVTTPSNYVYFLDLSVGSGNSIVLENLHWITRPNFSPGIVYLPLALPAGEPLYARISSRASSATVNVIAHCVRSSFNTSRAYALGTSYGATVGSSSGTVVDPGAVGDTKGSWTEITSSTSRTIRSLLICAAQGYEPAAYPASYGNINWLIDIGVGGAGSETILIPDLTTMTCSTSDGFDVRWMGPFDVTIPAATRIAIRCQCDYVADANTRLIRFALIGFD